MSGQNTQQPASARTASQIHLYDVVDAIGHRILEAQRIDTVSRFMLAHNYHPHGPLGEWRHDTHPAPLNYARTVYAMSVPPELAPTPTFEALLLRGRFSPEPTP